MSQSPEPTGFTEVRVALSPEADCEVPIEE